MARTVLVFSDSRGNTGFNSQTPANGSWPQIVDAARADLTMLVRHKNGRTTVEGLTQIDAAIADAQAAGEFTDGILLLGVADLLSVTGATSVDVAQRLDQMAAKIETAGARAWICAEPPGPIAWGGYAWMDARRFTRDNVAEVAKLGRRVIQMRDEFQRPSLNWYVTTNSNDQLHPTGIPARQAMADAVLAVLP